MHTHTCLLQSYHINTCSLRSIGTNCNNVVIVAVVVADKVRNPGNETMLLRPTSLLRPFFTVGSIAAIGLEEDDDEKSVKWSSAR